MNFKYFNMKSKKLLEDKMNYKETFQQEFKKMKLENSVNKSVDK
jgi:hypothetical protein